MKLLTVSSLLALFLFTGCFSKQEIIEKTKYVQKEPLNINSSPIFLKEVYWKVLIVDGVPYYGLQTSYYENLSLNMKTILNHIKEQDNIISKYKEYYEIPDNNNDNK